MKRLLLVFLLLMPAAAGAQQRAPAAPPQSPRDAVAPGPGPQERGSLDSAAVRARLLDDLYGRLAAAPSAADATPLEEAIEAILSRTGSPTADLLMAWVADEVRGRNWGRAQDYLDGVILLSPDFAQAYYRRAQVAFSQGDMRLAMADLERTLALEPRHFGALVGLGAILRELGKPREALGAFRAALALHPRLETARRAAELLESRVEGRDG